MVKLAIFDLDGTLLDTIDDLATSTNHALEEYGFPAHPLDAYRYFVGNGVRKLIGRALPEGAADDDTVENIREAFVRHYTDHNTDLTKPYAGIPEVLETLRKAGIELAVASNKYQQATEKLTRYYFGDDAFRVILGQREGITPKPDPTIVHDILAATGYDQSETIYIGDSCVDMQTAKNGGLPSVGVTWGFRPRQELEENGADFLAETPDELLQIILSHKSGQEN